jgi:preprotein translocase subunit SecA
MHKRSIPEHVEQRLTLAEQYHFALSRARGIPIETDLQVYNKMIDEVVQLDFTRLPDDQITQRARENAEEILSGMSRGQGGGRSRRGRKDGRDRRLITEVLALASEASARVLGQRLYPVQLLAAIAINDGKLAQMGTGEGKTLAAVPAAFLNSIGGGCHVLTANDYLARRDADWMGDVYAMLGCRAAFVNDDTPLEEKIHAYRADVVYLTPRRAGFDFLSDQLAMSPSDRVQLPFHSAIVDEADSLLIDESRIPLVIARESELARIDPHRIDEVVGTLVPETDFVTDRAGRRCVLTPGGHETVRRKLECPGIDEPDGLPWYAAVNVSLHAHHLLTRDEDYIVRGGRIELVDGFTGRVADERRWPDGIQAALEAKEAVSVRTEGEVCGSITIQHFIDRYPKLAGMTATAVPSARELHEFYGLAVVVVPGNKPSNLTREPDHLFSTLKAKNAAIVTRVVACHNVGQPVLVGTPTVRESEELALRIEAADIPCVVLNARNDEEEARIIAEAGRVGAVTISTNMAGRGTDIHLGGADEHDREQVASLGGLCVIGTNRHESSRVDEQLAGRAGRQGDPGVACIYVSLEDDLVQHYAITDLIPPEHCVPGDREIHDPTVAREIQRAQTIIGEQHFTMRRTLRDYSELVERRRRELEQIRDEALNHHAVPDALRAAVESAGGTPDHDRRAVAICFMQALDSAWAGYLEWTGIVREGIHLRRYSGRSPLLEFVDAASDEFDRVLDDAVADAAERYARWLTAAPEERDQMIRPASTWTYLISDNPFPQFALAGLVGGNVIAALSNALYAPVLIMAVLARWLSGRRK